MSAALRLSLGALSVVSSLSLSAAAIAGPDWDEGPNDAGSTLDTSQTITTDGSLTSIRGKLGGPGLLAGDYQDCFMIRVSDPTVFSVTTAPGAGGPPARPRRAHPRGGRGPRRRVACARQRS